MKSKQQKSQELAGVRALLEKAQSLVFVDFSKTPVVKIHELKKTLRVSGAQYKVMKKRLYKILFKEKNISVQMDEFGGQFAAIFSNADISDPAGVAFRFAKQQEKEGSQFTLIGGVDIQSHTVYTTQDIQRIGQLPSRDILLGQFVGMLQAPMRMLAYTLAQIEKNKQ